MGSYEFYTVRRFEQKIFDNKMLTGTMEDYLEMLYRCSIKGAEYIRLRKVAELLNVKDSTASKMMKKLKELELVQYEKYGIIKLTELGTEVGRYLYDRHNIVEKLLSFICEGEEAFIETELIEHSLSYKTVQNLDILYKFISDNDDIALRFNEFKEKRAEIEKKGQP